MGNAPLIMSTWRHSCCECFRALPVFLDILVFLSTQADKRAWYTLFAHGQFSQDFWEFGNSRKICSITLTSAKHADFSHKKMPATDPALCRRWQGSNKSTQLFACKSYPQVCPFQLTLWHMNDAIFSFEVHRSPRTKQCRPLPSKRYCFRLQYRPYVSHREYNHAVRPFWR